MFSIKPRRSKRESCQSPCRRRLLRKAKGHTRSKLDTERLARPQYRVSNRHTRRLLVNLDGRLVGIDSDDLCSCAGVGGGTVRTAREMCEGARGRSVPPTSSSCPTRTCDSAIKIQGGQFCPPLCKRSTAERFPKPRATWATSLLRRRRAAQGGTHELVHRRSNHVLSDDDGSRNTKNGTVPRFSVLISDLLTGAGVREGRNSRFGGRRGFRGCPSQRRGQAMGKDCQRLLSQGTIE